MRRILLSILFLALLFSTQAQVSDGQPTSSNQDAAGIAEQVRGGDTASTGFVAKALHWYDAHMNYTAVGILMTVESSFITFPSEVVIPPAVYVAANPESEGGMKIWLIVVVGTLGAMLGAFINYYLSRWLGRPIIYKFADSRLGHMLSLSGVKIEKAEKYFNEHGNVSTLVGRLIPVIRQLISIPAGLSKMNIGAFAFFTFIGAAVWNCILALLGWLAYKAAKPSQIEEYSDRLSMIIIILFCAAIAYFIVKVIWKKKKDKKSL